MDPTTRKLWLPSWISHKDYTLKLKEDGMAVDRLLVKFNNNTISESCFYFSKNVSIRHAISIARLTHGRVSQQRKINTRSTVRIPIIFILEYHCPPGVTKAKTSFDRRAEDSSNKISDLNKV